MPRTSRSWLSAIPFPSVILLALLSSAEAAASSTKRGLVYTPNTQWPQDGYIWTRQPSDLTWYYNYGVQPTPLYSNITQTNFEFVPMLWGAPSDSADTTFLTTVKSLIKDRSVNITHVMTFNEPDGPTAYGGSDVDPTLAAKVWINNIIPLQKMGIKVGLPACTGGWGGMPWMKQFLGNCSAMISTDNAVKNCTFDFVPLHYYGAFDGLASHIGEWYGTFNTSIWITEYNYNDQDLVTTQTFYNGSADYLDRLDYVERYSMFAGFRSIVANVGPNAAMLSAGGQLTDMGAWYLGRSATGVDPASKASNAAGKFMEHWPLAGAVTVVAIVALLGL